MSVTKNAAVSVAKDVEEYLRRSHFRRGGLVLERRQNKIYRDSLYLTALAWYDLIPSEATHTPRWMIPWLRAIVETDLLIVVKTLKLAAEWLVENVSVFANYDIFKQCLRASGCRCDIIAPTKGLVEAWFLYRDQDSFRRLRTAFLFITRINLPGLSDLESQAAERYVAIDKSLSSDILLREREIITSWFPALSAGFLYENWFPKHGPGSTSDAGKIKLSKYEMLGQDDMIRRLDLLIGGKTMPEGCSSKTTRQSKVVFVPKTIDKLRTICMEPATLQWYQQGFAHSIEEYMRNHAYLRRRIDLRDQEMSRELAYLGSIDGNLATIDLSDASDSVSWDLIRQWMQHSSLLPILWMTRARCASVPGYGVMSQAKFAPMGSALCFPVECIVFAAIVEASIQSVGGSTHDSLYRVYGDDIIVETRYANEVIRRLTENGFRPNASKSFYRRETRNFRESCGGEFLDGIDVTPLRLSRRFSGLTEGRTKDTASSIAAMVDLCNTFYSVLPTVRRALIWDLNRLPIQYRPVFDHDGTRGIFSPQPTNFHLPKPTYVKRYQQWYILHGGTKDEDESVYINNRPTIPNHPEYEMFRLYEHLRATHGRASLSSPEDRVHVALSRKSRLKWVVIKTPLEQVVNPDNPRDKGDLEE